MNSLELAKQAVSAALMKKAINPLLLKVVDLVNYTNFFLILSGQSTHHVIAISETILQLAKKIEIQILNVNGLKEGHWVLIDLGEIIIHVFHQPIRIFYNLELMWIDAPRIKLDKINNTTFISNFSSLKNNY